MPTQPEPGDARPRTAVEIARRALVLHCVISAAFDYDRYELQSWLSEESLTDEISPQEAAFLSNSTPSELDVRKFRWRPEAQVVLLWSILKVDALPEPNQPAVYDILFESIPMFKSTKLFIETARMRDDQEILLAEDRIYDIHCDIRSAYRNRRPLPQVEHGVIYQRQYAFDWMRVTMAGCGMLKQWTLDHVETSNDRMLLKRK